MKKTVMLMCGKVKGHLKARIGHNAITELNRRAIVVNTYKAFEKVRPVRSLEHIAHYKASEWAEFLFVTGPIILQNVIASSYYKHFLKLSSAIRILCNEELLNSHPEYIDIAAQWLKSYITQFSSLYGKDMVTFLVHALLHLPECVKAHGNLLSFSCFKFEDKCGKLKVG